VPTHRPERETMTSSPCRHCSKKNLPKEDCIDQCEKIQMIQSFIVAQGSMLRTRSDYSDMDDVRAAIPGGGNAGSYYYL
jgi:hypothetical protein